jgi:hypothetical protein
MKRRNSEKWNGHNGNNNENNDNNNNVNIEISKKIICK